MKLEAHIYREERERDFSISKESRRAADLTVGVGVGAAHYLPSVLKDLYPQVAPAQLRDLIGPFVDDSSDLWQCHQRQSEIRSRVETHHTTVKTAGEEIYSQQDI